MTDYVTAEVEKKYEERKEGFASKADVYSLKEDISSVKGDVQTVKTEIARLETKIAESSTTNTRWVIGLFMALALMIIGLYIRR